MPDYTPFHSMHEIEGMHRNAPEVSFTGIVRDDPELRPQSGSVTVRMEVCVTDRGANKVSARLTLFGDSATAFRDLVTPGTPIAVWGTAVPTGIIRANGSPLCWIDVRAWRWQLLPRDMRDAWGKRGRK